MRGSTWLVVLSGALCQPVLGADPQAKTIDQRAVAEDLVPDPRWVPEAGQRLEVQIDQVKATSTLETFKQGSGRPASSEVTLSKGSLCVVVRGHRPPPPPRAQTSYVVRGANATSRAIQNSAVGAIQPSYEAEPVEVRVEEGPLKGKTLFVAEATIAPRVPRRAPRGVYVATEPSGKVIDYQELPVVPELDAKSDPKLRAAKLNRAAMKAEKSGSVASVVAAYHALIHDFPGTPEAERAKARMKAIGVQRRDDGDYFVNPFGSRRKR